MFTLLALSVARRQKLDPHIRLANDVRIIFAHPCINNYVPFRACNLQARSTSEGLSCLREGPLLALRAGSALGW